MKFLQKWLVITVWIISAVLLLPLPAVNAHPHIFIEQRLGLVFDDKGLAGIKVRWKFDDMFAAMIAEDHDRNRNGRFEPGEVQSVREKAFAFIKEHSYFMFVKIDNTPFQVEVVSEFNAILEDKRLVYEFLVPCRVPAASHSMSVSIASYDPTYYTAIYFSEKRSVSLTSADDFDVKTALKEDPDTTIYFGLIHPWTLFLEFKRKS